MSAPAAEARTDASNTRLWVGGIAVTLVALVFPALVVGVARSDRGVGDIALIELRTRDVLSSHPPLTGVYSRYGWSHPGPLMYYVYALPYRLFGGDTDALRLTALLVNVVVLIALAWLVWRRGRAATVAVLGATVALVWGMLPHSLIDGWNVTIAVLSLLLAIVGCWSALCGDRFGLPISAVASVFVVHAHVGFGVVIAPVFLATLAWCAIRGLRARDKADVRHVALVIVGCVVLFLPVLYDMARHWPGNLGDLLKWSVNNDEDKLGAGNALRLIGRTSSLSFPLHPQFPGGFLLSIETVTAGFLPGVLLLALAAALVVAWRRGWHDEALFCCVVATTWLTGFVAAMTISRPLAPWLIEWLQPLGWITYGAIALVLWRVIQSAFSSRTWWRVVPTALAAIGVVVLVVGTIAFARAEANTDYLAADAVDAVDELSSAADAAAGPGPVFVEFTGDPLVAGTMFNGVVNQLDAAGRDVCVPADRAYQFGSSRVCAVAPATHLVIRSEPMAMLPPEGTATVAIVDPLSEQQRDEVDALTAELSALLDANGLAGQVPLLYSPLAHLVLSGNPPTEVLEAADDIARLNELRQIPGARFGLYQRVG